MKRIIGLLVLILLCVGLFPQPVSAHTGSGTIGDPYIAYNVTDLQDIQNHLSSYWELASDIDASVTATWNWDAGRGVYEGFVPISAFSGNFDGNGYSITSLYINRDYASTALVGLFGGLYGTGDVANVLVEDADITIIKSGADAVYGGILVGDCQGDIYQCGVSGSIVCNGTSWVVNGVGGLVGAMHYATTIVSKSFSYANIEYRDTGGFTNVAAGGLVGYHGGGYIYDSYARGDVYGYSTYAIPPSVGGLVGRIYQAYISRSYSTGLVSAFNTGRNGGLVGSSYQGVTSASFWDYETSGLGGSAGGSARSTSQMKTESTFTGAGWDFTMIWAIGGLNNGYPFLWWWYDPITWPGGFSQVIWYQPDDIIEGAVLPDRAVSGGTENGTITWGTNPAGVSPVLTGFYSDYAPTNITFPQDIVNPQDMIGPTGQQDRTADIGTLVGNPFYPLVKAFSDNTGIPVKLWWIILASIIVLIVMVVTYWKLPHLMITALAGGSLSAFFYAMGIYPFWVVLIFAVMAFAIILGERSPTV